MKHYYRFFNASIEMSIYHRHTPFFSLVAVFWVIGCSHFTGATDSGRSPVAYCVNQADNLIQQDELQQAWYYLDVARQLDPENKMIREKINVLKDDITQKADHHFKQGVTEYNRHHLADAQKEFLTVLRYFPEHRAAAEYLTNRIQPKHRIVYRMQKGDTAETIADTVYHNKELAFLVQYFLPSEQQTAGPDFPLIHLPILKKQWAMKSHRKKKAVMAAIPEIEASRLQTKAQAQKLFQKGRYRQVIALVEDMAEQNPDDQEVMHLYNYSCYYEGKRLIEKKELLPAREMLRRVKMDLTDIEQVRSLLQSEMKKQSEIHYRKGLTFFINENLKQSIMEWEKTIALDPENEKARKAIKNAQNLLKKLEGVN